MASDKKLLSRAIQLASLNIALQVAFRISTFVLNAFVLRYVTKEVLGVVNVRLTLLYSTILFLSHEAFRKTCLNPDTLKKWRANVSILWLTFPAAILCCILFGTVWIVLLEAPSLDITPNYKKAVFLICFACLMEKLVEPLYVAAQALHFVRTKVVIEGVAQLVKVLEFAILVSRFSGQLDPVLSFCYAQVSYSLVYALSYIFVFAVLLSSGCELRFAFLRRSKKSEDEASEKELLQEKEGGEAFPFKTVWDFLPDQSMVTEVGASTQLGLTWSFFKQGFLKQILTEGERYVMTFFPVLSFADQGVFDLVNNLGSLAARFIFLPVEEAAYFYFSQTVRRENKEKDEDSDAKNKESMEVLKTLVRAMTLLGLTIFFFAIPYAEPFIFLYGGPKLANSEAPKLLTAHAFYVIFLAVNGVTECFSFASMTKEMLEQYNMKLLFMSGAFLVGSYVLTVIFGSVGFIFANCCNMALRILHSVFVIKKRDAKGDVVKALAPNKLTLAVLVLSSCLGFISKVWVYPRSLAIHLMIGATVFLWSFATFALSSERDLFLSAVGYFWRRHARSHAHDRAREHAD